MKRSELYVGTHWDDPFWQTVRMCVDVLGGRAAKRQERPLSESELLASLQAKGTSASEAFVHHLHDHPELTERVADYLYDRVIAVQYMLAQLRTEEEAQAECAKSQAMSPSRNTARRAPTIISPPASWSPP